MLEWLRKENTSDSLSENTMEKTQGNNDCLAVLFNKRKALRIDDVPVTVGKSAEEADLSFYHDSVSNVHCRIDCQNREFTITDLGSKTGTQVNGEKIKAGEPFPIDINDTIVIGKVKFDVIIYYDEVARRERMAMLAAKANEQPEEKTYTIYAREVNIYEYEESEVVHISCGLEPEAKKGSYTQEFTARSILDAIRSAEEAKSRSEEAESEPAAEAKPEQEPLPLTEQPPEPLFQMPREDSQPEPEESDSDRKELCLLSTDALGGQERLVIDHFPFKMGRSKINDYVLRIDKISREHISITEKNGSFFVTDLNSTNGVRVNGIKIDPAKEYKIGEGDTIKLSNKVFTVGSAE